jgi:hypothetical protein
MSLVCRYKVFLPWLLSVIALTLVYSDMYHYKKSSNLWRILHDKFWDRHYQCTITNNPMIEPGGYPAHGPTLARIYKPAPKPNPSPAPSCHHLLHRTFHTPIPPRLVASIPVSHPIRASRERHMAHGGGRQQHHNSIVALTRSLSVEAGQSRRCVWHLGIGRWWSGCRRQGESHPRQIKGCFRI